MVNHVLFISLAIEDKKTEKSNLKRKYTHMRTRRKANSVGHIVFFTNLMHNFFILMHLLHSSTCFDHCYAHLQEDNCINTTSGVITLFR